MSALSPEAVTFLFTDIEGSTHLLQRLGDREFAPVLAEHRRLLRMAFSRAGGTELGTHGDGFLVAFPNARTAVEAAILGQRVIRAHQWPQQATVRVRIGLHAGEAVRVADGYVGLGVHRAARMCSAAHGDQILISERTGEVLKDHLPDSVSLRDLGLYRLKDLERPERILQVLHPDLPADFPALRSQAAALHNLPAQLTSFIGREHEVANVKRLLTTTRLLTLTGSGGSGKTRLAIRVAADLTGDFDDGVWMVDLASLSDPALIPKAVASTLGMHEQPGHNLLDLLLDAVRPKALLLVLDNCEHLIAACARLIETLAQSCPRIRLLVTSREPLGIPGEIVWQVPCLSLPGPGAQSADALALSEAVRLFVERAVAARPDFAFTVDNARPVARICRRLDGIPLAIELAAARIKVLSASEIAARLDDRFRLLVGGSRTALPRYQTLRATMDWSYGLLSGSEQSLLRRLSVFAGGFTLEAAESICKPVGAHDFYTIDLLTQLVNKSLVLADPRDREVRYRLLETVREYGREKLEQAGEGPTTRALHRDWFLGFAEAAESKIQGREGQVWLDRLELEHDNLREALAWSLSDGQDAVIALRFACALFMFWDTRSHVGEGRRWLEAALASTGPAPAGLRAKALGALGGIAKLQGDLEASRRFRRESLRIFRESGERRGVAWQLRALGWLAQDEGAYDAARALHTESLAISREDGDEAGGAIALLALGWMALDQGDYSAARRLLGESLAISTRLGDDGGIAITLRPLGWIAQEQGDYAEARSLHERSLALFRGLGNRGGVAISYYALGRVAQRTGDLKAATALYEESLGTFRQQGNRWGTGWALHGLGHVARLRGNYDTALSLLTENLSIFRGLAFEQGIGVTLGALGTVARLEGHVERAAALFAEALDHLRAIGDKVAIAGCLEGLAGVAAGRGAHPGAAYLLGAAQALRDATGAPVPPCDLADYQEIGTAVRAGVSDHELEFERRGLSMRLEEIVEGAGALARTLSQGSEAVQF